MGDYKITRADCITILQKHFGHSDVEVLDYEEKSLGEEVLGIMAGHFKLHVNARVKNASVIQKFFVKRMHAAFEVQNRMIKQQKAYEKEAFMYEFFDKVVQIQPKYNLDITAKCYLTVPNELFILEDLSESGYITNKSGDYQIDLDQYLLTMDSIAKFHAASIIYETKQAKHYQITDDFIEFLMEPLYREDEEYLGNKLLKSSVIAVLAIMDVMPQLENKEETKMKFRYNADKMYDLVKPSGKYRNVICHGDLWSNNLFFRYMHNMPVHCKLIDFQALRYTVPALDFVSVLYYSLHNEFIRESKSMLSRAYYNSLKNYLAKCDIDINDHITWKELEETMEYIRPFVIVQKIIFSLMVALTFDKRIQTNQDDFENFMYINKADICVQFYMSNPFYKHVMDAAVQNLDDL